VIRVDREKLFRSSYRFSVFWDILMLAIISINLTWLIIDVLFSHPVFNSLLEKLWPSGHVFFEQVVHPQFPVWDLVFVGFYCLEILWCWARSVYKKTYYRWWFYPFVHWYDVLGSLPIASFRFLRLFRAVTLLYRLQRYGILDVSQTFIFRFFRKYLAVIVEEVSDRVVIRVLEGVETEIRSGNPVTHRVMSDVVGPRRYQLGQWLGDRITDLIEQSYHSRQDEALSYLEQLVHVAVKDNAELKRLTLVPGVGGYVAGQIERAISDITFGVLSQLAEDLHGDQSTGLIHEATEVLFQSLSEPGGHMNQIVEAFLLDFIQVIKDEVAIQKWKLEPALTD